MKLEKILAAIDGSDASFKALDYASSLANAYSASLTIIMVEEPLSPAPALVQAAVVEQYLDEMKTYYEETIKKGMERALKANKKLRVDMVLRKGRAWEKIVEECRNGGYDLLVMGSRGQGGIRGLLLGSVSRRAVEEAPCPVLIVKSEPKVEPPQPKKG